MAMYDVVVADARAPRDGRFIEKIGTYNPLTVPAKINLDDEKAFTWLMNGAQPTDTVKAMLSYRGVMMKKHLQIGVIKGALTQEQADAKLAEWLKEKETKIEAKRDKATQSKEATAKERKAAETKIKEARAEAIRKKAEVAAAVPEPAAVAEVEAVEAVAEGTAEEAKPEAPAAEAPAAEAPAAEAPASDTTEKL